MNQKEKKIFFSFLYIQYTSSKKKKKQENGKKNQSIRSSTQCHMFYVHVCMCIDVITLLSLFLYQSCHIYIYIMLAHMVHIAMNE